MALPIK